MAVVEHGGCADATADEEDIATAEDIETIAQGEKGAESVALFQPTQGCRARTYDMNEKVETIGCNVAPIDADGTTEHDAGFTLDA